METESESRLDQRLVGIDQDEAIREDENHAKVDCLYCGGKHLGELYESPPDGFYVVYYCVEKESRGRRSFP